nr:hypothetical protein GCM10020093_030380 [Planobispora longispora]
MTRPRRSRRRWPRSSPRWRPRGGAGDPGGEDDAEDAQWVVAVEDPEDTLEPDDQAWLDELAEQYEGWRETD